MTSKKRSSSVFLQTLGAIFKVKQRWAPFVPRFQECCSDFDIKNHKKTLIRQRTLWFDKSIFLTLLFLLFSITSIVYGFISHSPIACVFFPFAIAKAKRQDASNAKVFSETNPDISRAPATRTWAQLVCKDVWLTCTFLGWMNKTYRIDGLIETPLLKSAPGLHNSVRLAWRLLGIILSLWVCWNPSVGIALPHSWIYLVPSVYWSFSIHISVSAYFCNFNGISYTSF